MRSILWARYFPFPSYTARTVNLPSHHHDSSTVLLLRAIFIPAALLATHPEELAQTRIVRLAGLPLCIFQIFGEPESTNLQHPIQRLVRRPDSNKSVRRIEVVPVLEIRRRLEEL